MDFFTQDLVKFERRMQMRTVVNLEDLIEIIDFIIVESENSTMGYAFYYDQHSMDEPIYALVNLDTKYSNTKIEVNKYLFKGLLEYYGEETMGSLDKFFYIPIVKVYAKRFTI